MIPIRPYPQKDEILSSWLIRCSVANASDPESFGGGIWNEYRIWTRDFDRYLPKTRAGPLCKAVSMSYEQISDMTLEPIIARITKNDLNPNTAWPWVIPTGTRNRSKFNGLHFCPECLKQSPTYFKKQWRLSWNTVCPEHGCLLQLRCPKCHTAFSPHLINYLDTDVGICRKCGYDLRQLHPEKADKDVLQLQERLNQAAFAGEMSVPWSLIEDIHDLFAITKALMTLFHRISRCQAVQRAACELLGEDTFPDIIYSGSILEMADVYERHFLMSLVAKIFELDLETVVKLFVDAGITQQMWKESVHEYSSLGRYFLSVLPDNGRGYPNVPHPKKVIGPRSKEDVEKLMDEIRKYL